MNNVQAGLAWLFTTEVNFTPLETWSSEVFKDAMCELWVEWMMNSVTEATSVGNYKAPALMEYWLRRCRRS